MINTKQARPAIVMDIKNIVTETNVTRLTCQWYSLCETKEDKNLFMYMFMTVSRVRWIVSVKERSHLRMLFLF